MIVYAVTKAEMAHRVSEFYPTGATRYMCGDIGRGRVGVGNPGVVWCAPCALTHDGYMVYRIWSKAGDLLYVGCTAHYINRIRQHRTKPWWPEVTRITVEHYLDIYEASDAEQTAIAAEKPLHNARGRGATASYSAMYAPGKWAVA